MSKPEAVIAHPIWGRGGAEVAAMWIIDALQEDFDVTLYVRGGFDLDALNEIAGTSIARNTIQLKFPTRVKSVFGGAVAHRLYLNEARQLAPNFDLRVTASGSIAWGLPAVQFLSSLVWHPELRENFLPKAPSLRLSYLRQRLTEAMIERIWPRPYSNSSQDLFVANSEWTASHSRAHTDARIVVIYPGVKVPNPQILRTTRQNGHFLCFGRISHEKKIERCIEILERVSVLADGIRLDVVGPTDSNAYLEFLKNKVRRSKLEVRFLAPVHGQLKADLFASHSFGINCCDVEAFGISTAEMAASGLVVFAPHASAQSEVLPNSLQLYSSDDEAVQNIASVLNDNSLRVSLSAANIEYARRFCVEHFKSRTRQYCAEFLAQNPKNGSERGSVTTAPPPQRRKHLRALSVLTRSGPLILCYHNIIPDELYDASLHLGVSHRASTFERHVSIASRLFNIHTDIENARAGDCVFTFDDGYKNNLLSAAILSRYRASGVFFVCASSFFSGKPLIVDDLLKWLAYLPTGFYRPFADIGAFEIGDYDSKNAVFHRIHGLLCKGLVGDDELRDSLERVYPFSKLAIDPQLDDLRFSPLNEREIVELQAGGHKIGCHSWGHRILTTLNDAELEEDFAKCNEFSSRYCNSRYFAYPFGGKAEVDTRVAEVAKRYGYHAAVLNIPKWPHALADLEKYFIGRVSVEEALPWPRQLARLVGADLPIVNVAKKIGLIGRA